jgi:DNA-binding transcriptional LysR family regulator
MDWDKVRIFHIVAEAGSFTKAGDEMDMSQSAVSRQISSLEADLKVALFHRHARGLILTEQGELLYKTAHDVFNKLLTTQTMLEDASDKPFGELRVTTTVGFGSAWLTPRLNSFINLYPGIQLQIILSDEELDIAMLEADVAIWLREPVQQDLIRRPMFTVHFHVYAANSYIKKFGMPKNLDDMDNHRILTFGGKAPKPMEKLNWLETAGLKPNEKRKPAVTINNLYSLRQAVKRGVGIAVLPDYLAQDDEELVNVLPDADVPNLNTYFVYPEELRNSKRITVFRDFLLAEARAWHF